MNFNEAAICLSIGIGLVAFILIVCNTKSCPKEGIGLEALLVVALFVVTVVGGSCWFLIAGLYWLIKTW
jgi:hypothetical protein